MIPNDRRCILCTDTDRDGNPRERNWAAPGTQTCTGHYERTARGLDVIPGEYVLLSAAPGSGTGQARVSGTGEQPLGVRVPVLDLMSPANTGAVHDLYGDQDGAASVASVLVTLCGDWIDYRGKNEALPVPSVTHMCAWLRDRLDWATEEVEVDDEGNRIGGGHPALLEFTHDIHRLVAALRSANGNLPQADDHRDGIECPRCDLMTLYDTVDYIECVESKHGCGRLLTYSEYAQWVEMRGYFLRAAIPCPSCGLTTLAGTRAHQRVECVVAKGGCGAQIPWAAYDKWATGVGAIEKAKVLLWGERHPLPGPASFQRAA